MNTKSPNVRKRSSLLALIALVLLAALVIGIVLLWPAFEKSDPLSNSDVFVERTNSLYGYSKDRDSDGDTLNDYDEHQLHHTDIFNCDTDLDGLYDNLELEMKTDPLKKDSDNDGIVDGTEVRAGTDPLIADSDRQLERELVIEDDDSYFSDLNITLKLNGNASIYDVVMEEFNVSGLTKTPGVISDACWVYSDNNTQGEISFAIDSAQEEVSIYQLNDKTEYVKIKTEINSLNDGRDILTARVGNGKYLVGVCSFLDNYKANEDLIDVFLLIDDSGSMYDEMMEGKGNDPQHKRIDMCKQLLNNAPDSIRFGLATFTDAYMQKSGLVEDRTELLSALDTVANTSYEDKEAAGQFQGTYIATSLYKALDNFNSNSPRRQVIVILTDGETTEGQGLAGLFGQYNHVWEVVDKADELNVSIITVALGAEVDIAYLTEIEEETDGAYIYANNANAMEDLYAAILNAVNYNFIDNNEDGTADEILVANSGFKPEQHGFKFHNPVVSNGAYDSFGICYGISAFSSLYYQQKLETTMSDIDEFDYDLWFLRAVVGAFEDGIVQEKINGYDIDVIKKAGLHVDDDGNIIYDFDLGAWSTNEAVKYQEYFDWEFDSEYYDENSRFTDAAKEILKQHKMINAVTYGEGENSFDIPYYLIRYDSSELSADEQKTNSMLQLLWRHHFIQFLGEQDEYTYLMENDTDVICQSVESGIPLVLCTSNHAVVVCGIRQDINNPNKYYFDLYDSNYCGEPTTMEAEIKINSDGEKYTQYTYGESFTNVSIYNIHVG